MAYPDVAACLIVQSFALGSSYPRRAVAPQSPICQTSHLNADSY